MSLKITINWSVNVETGTGTFDLENVGISTIEEWEALSIGDMDSMIQELLDELPSPVFAMADNWEIKES